MNWRAWDIKSLQVKHLEANCSRVLSGFYLASVDSNRRMYPRAHCEQSHHRWCTCMNVKQARLGHSDEVTTGQVRSSRGPLLQ